MDVLNWKMSDSPEYFDPKLNPFIRAYLEKPKEDRVEHGWQFSSPEFYQKYQGTTIPSAKPTISEIKKLTKQKDQKLRLEDYVILEGKVHGNSSYPDLLVSKKRKYRGSDWLKSHLILHQEGSFMLTLRQFIDYASLLKTGEVYDGTGNKVSWQETKDLFLDLTRRGNPLRGEWLDAFFSGGFNNMRIGYGHRLVQGLLEPRTSEIVKGHLDRNGRVSIFNPTTCQGFPIKEDKQGLTEYWPPQIGCAVRYWVAGNIISLDCHSDPDKFSNVLGVRPARKK